MYRVVWGLCLLFGMLSPVLAKELRVALWTAEAAAGSGQRVTPPSLGLRTFNEDLAREICRRLQARCKFEPVVFAEMQPGLEANLFDLAFGNYLRTPEREKRFAFSDPIWRSSSRLVGRPAHLQRLATRLAAPVTLDSLRDAEVVVVGETLQHAYLRAFAAERGLRLQPVKTMNDVFSALREGRADIALVPMMTAFGLLDQDGANSLEFVGPPIFNKGLGGTVHIGLPKSREALRQSVNRVIADMRADGTWQRIVRRNFPFNLD